MSVEPTDAVHMNVFTEQLQDLPFATADIPGTGGRIKTYYEDFLVEEIPLYLPSGKGSHVYAWVQKKGMTTPDIVATFSKRLRIPRSNIGYAGLKDARAITKQWISLEGPTPEEVLEVDIPKMTIFKAVPHANKLKIGHSRGNAFIIKLREMDVPLPEALARAEAAIEKIAKIGLPNFYGPQRFGSRFDSHILGRYVIRDQPNEFIDLMLGQPKPGHEPENVTLARQLYDQGEYNASYNAWPMHYYEHRRTLKTMMNNDNARDVAFKYLERRSKRFYVSALQSAIFNMVIIDRMPNIGTILPGDLAWKHDNGACFIVEDAAVEQKRADALEISPSGPLMGPKMSKPVEQAGEIENHIIAQAELSDEELQNMNFYRLKGSRRPIRILPRELSVQAGQDEFGDYLEFSFQLDPGGYATTLLREITKIPNLA